MCWSATSVAWSFATSALDAVDPVPVVPDVPVPLPVRPPAVLVEAPDEEAGSVLMHNIIPRLSDTPGRLRTAAPSLGQHNTELLSSLGRDAAAIAALVATGVIKES